MGIYNKDTYRHYIMSDSLSEFSEKYSWYKKFDDKRIYELSAEKKVLASLIWMKDIGTLAEGSSADGKWTFKRTGFFKPSITVRKLNDEQNYATLRFNWTNESELLLPNGKKYFWKNLNLWRGEWGFVSEKNNIVLQTVPNYNKRGADGFVYYNHKSIPKEDLYLLILISWYIIVSYSEEETISAHK